MQVKHHSSVMVSSTHASPIFRKQVLLQERVNRNTNTWRVGPALFQQMFRFMQIGHFARCRICKKHYNQSQEGSSRDEKEAMDMCLGCDIGVNQYRSCGMGFAESRAVSTPSRSPADIEVKLFVITKQLGRDISRDWHTQATVRHVLITELRHGASL